MFNYGFGYMFNNNSIFLEYRNTANLFEPMCYTVMHYTWSTFSLIKNKESKYFFLLGIVLIWWQHFVKTIRCN